MRAVIKVILQQVRYYFETLTDDETKDFPFKNLGKDYADLLEAVGVESVSDLKRRNPESLHEMMNGINKRKKIVDRMPSLKRVTRWIDDSKDIVITVSS